MLMLSSSTKLVGRSFTCLRKTARGIRGPSVARAKMTTVSVSVTLERKAASNSTVAPAAAGEAGRAAAATGAVVATGAVCAVAGWPARVFASPMLFWVEWAMSGTNKRILFHYVTTPP